MNADLIARLIEAGTPAALVAEVATELARAQASVEVLETRKAKDRERKRSKEFRGTPRNSKESAEFQESPPDGSPKEYNQTPSLAPRAKTEAKASSKSLAENEKREAIASCLRRAFPSPDGVTAEQWGAFRKQRKKPLNERSYTLLVNKLQQLAEDGWPPGEMIDLAIERGWETVFPPRNFGNERRNTPSPIDQLVAASFSARPGTG